MTKEEMQELRSLMGEVIDEKLKPIREDISGLKQEVAGLKKDVAAVKEDTGIIKEEAQITRHSTNLLLTWAEKADRSLNVGLYEKE